MRTVDSHPSWLVEATRWPVVRRAIGYAIVVGAVLILINHGDAILRGELSGERLLRMGLTVLVPYLVSTFSAVAAIRQFRRAATPLTQAAPAPPAPPRP